MKNQASVTSSDPPNPVTGQRRVIDERPVDLSMTLEKQQKKHPSAIQWALSKFFNACIAIVFRGEKGR